MRSRTFLPRPEYPRPDRQRAFLHGIDWLNLNGPWDFRFDPHRRGVEERWFADESRWPDQLIVPFCWESLAAWGEADAAGNDNFYSTRVYRNPLEVTTFNYRSAARYEVGWYRRTVVLPQNETWKDKRTILTIGAADFFTTAWCNGQELGRHEGGYTPFEFDLTSALRAGKDGRLTGTIVLRVKDPMDNHEQPVGKQWGWYCSASGIWQTVFIEPRPAHYIERFEITTDIDRAEVRFVVSSQGGERLTLDVESPSGRTFHIETAVQSDRAEALLALGTAELWDPSAPQLYRVRLCLSGTGPPDVVHSYFGMRSLSAEKFEESDAPASLCLNGEAIYLRGALYQSYHPEGIYTAGDLESLREDILAAKRAGFDLLRIHIKVDDPLVLYLADTIGILIMADFPNFGEGGDTPRGRHNYETMMRAAIARDFNHPSIVAWCLFNETWGFGGQAEFVKLINPAPPISARADRNETPDAKVSNADAYQWVQAMWQLAKQLDPGRLVEDMSVVAWDHLQYYGHGETDVNSWHFYTNDYSKARATIADIVEKTYAGSTYNYVPGFQQRAQPLINSEYGGVGALDGDIDTSWSFKFLTNELRRHGKISAYIYTELHDVEWERNGILNYDRTPKKFGYDLTLVNQGDVLPIDAPPIRECRPGEHFEVEVCSSHFSRKRRHDVTLHWRLSGIDSLGHIHDDLAGGTETIAFPHLRVELAKRISLTMPREPMLCTLWTGAYVPDGTMVARNYIQFLVSSDLPEREEHDGRLILRLPVHDWSVAEWNESLLSREEAHHKSCCAGGGRGFFEWNLPIAPPELHAAKRITVLCEASACRRGAPQTDSFSHPTTFRMLLNNVRIYDTILPNHPHDARGAISYLYGGRGAYGYHSHATVEGALLAQVKSEMRDSQVRLRCAVPRQAPRRRGLTIYGAKSGRYPFPPTVIVE